MNLKRTLDVSYFLRLYSATELPLNLSYSWQVADKGRCGARTDAAWSNKDVDAEEGTPKKGGEG